MIGLACLEAHARVSVHAYVWTSMHCHKVVCRDAAGFVTRSGHGVRSDAY